MARIFTKYEQMTDEEIANKIREIIKEVNYLSEMAVDENNIIVEFIPDNALCDAEDINGDFHSFRFNMINVKINKPL